jgi:hypothetical protein
MRHTRIHKQALLLDAKIDAYRKARGLKNFPHRLVKKLIGLLFPRSSFQGKGWHKSAHKVSTRRRDLVLKTGNAKSIRRDYGIFAGLSGKGSRRDFAKVYWRTKYCMLQKFGQKKKVPSRELARLKEVARKRKLGDVREANVRYVDRTFKIIDASKR